MKNLLIILVILASHSIRSQDYFFEFVDGWVNNYCMEYSGNYNFLGLGSLDVPTFHEYQINELDPTGTTVSGTTYLNDSFLANSFLSGTSSAAVMSEVDEIVIAGYARITEDLDSIEGLLLKYKFETNEFEVMNLTNNDFTTQHYCIEQPNDSTYYVGTRSFIEGAPEIISLTNYTLDFEIRWIAEEFNLDNCIFCTMTPIQILPLSNGNIAYLYEEFKDLIQFTDRERAIIVILDGETGDQIGDPILVGDHENYRIWAGGMVEQSGELLVSYTQPYFYDEEDEWQFNHANTVHLSRYTTSGDELWTTSFLDEIPNGILDIGRYQYRISQTQELVDGNLLISGSTGYGGLLMKITPAGELIWNQEHFPHVFEDNEALIWNTRFLYSAPTSDGGFMCAGQYYSDPGNLYPNGIQTAIALKVDEYGCLEPDCQVGIAEIEKQSLEIYPNPSEGEFIIKIPDLRMRSGSYQLEVFNSLGEPVFTESSSRGIDIITIDLSEFSDGIYVVQLNMDGGVYSARVVKE